MKVSVKEFKKEYKKINIDQIEVLFLTVLYRRSFRGSVFSSSVLCGLVVLCLARDRFRVAQRVKSQSCDEHKTPDFLGGWKICCHWYMVGGLL